MIQSIVTGLGTLLIIIAILFLTYIVTKYIGNRMGAGRYAGGVSHYLGIVDRMFLGQEISVALIRVSERIFLVGITNDNINLLTEIKEEELTELSLPEVENSAGAANKDMMDRLKDRKK